MKREIIDASQLELNDKVVSIKRVRADVTCVLQLGLLLATAMVMLVQV